MLESWLAARGFECGSVVNAQTVYELGREWYATRLHADWTRPSLEAAQAIFTQHGLVGPFWALTT